MLPLEMNMNNLGHGSCILFSANIPNKS
jgi:hypothetical protein